MNRIARLAPLLVLVGACQDQSTLPTGARQSVAGAALSPCPPTTVTVTDEPGFREATAAATPGTVIGIQGMIGITADDTILTDGVTITCATPGSGLFAVAGVGVEDMLTVGGRHDVVNDLVLDGSQAGETPWLSLNDGATFFAESTSFIGNTVTCSLVTCAFIAGGIGTTVRDNHFQAAGPFSGIQLQPFSKGIDGTRLERNVLITTAPSTGGRQGAIRAVGGTDIVIADNSAIGPWRAGISATELANSRISGNTIQGAAQFGIQTSAQSPGGTLLVTNTAVLDNRITASGVAGVLVRLACGNTFVGNNLRGNAGEMGLVFDIATGANTYVGNNNVVVDNGAFDCDGDGVSDPNVVAGPGVARRGMNIGLPVSDAVTGGHGTPLQ